MRDVFWAGWWIAIYLVLVLAPVAVLLVGEVPGGLGFWWDFSLAIGFAALSSMGVQFVLTARFRRATAPYGIDVIYYFHRYVGLVALALVVLHAAGLLLVNPAFVGVLDPTIAPPHMLAGVGSALALLLLIVSSIWRQPLHLHYDAWRFAHGPLAVAAVALALWHVRGVGYYAAAGWKDGFWVAVGALWAALYAYVRLVRPWLSRRRPYRVTSVTPERASSWTVAVAPEGHDGIDFQPGQFAWLTLRHSPFAMREHPFSISSSPRPDGRLEFTIEELGDFTSTIGSIRPGETAYVDGPYGAFTIDRYPQALSYVFIGGGIGMAPLMSMLRTLAERGDRRPLYLITANRRLDRIPFRQEIEALTTRLDLKVAHVLEDPPEGWRGERGRIEPALLERHLPADRRAAEYFVCGPRPMIDAVERFLYDLGVPLTRSHSELFDLV